MNAESYAGLISWVWSCRVSLVSAATSHEQRVEHDRLTRAVENLKAARLSRHNQRLKDRTEICLKAIEPLLAEYKVKFKAADANLANMAFGAEWR